MNPSADRPQGILPPAADTVSNTSIPEISEDQQHVTEGHSIARESLAFLLILAAVALVVYRNSYVDTRSEFSLLRMATARFRVMILIETISLQNQLGAAGDNRLLDQSLTAVRQIEEEAVSPEGN